MSAPRATSDGRMGTSFEVLAFAILLRSLGVLMAVASRTSERFRQQVTRDLLVAISSADGASQHFQLRAASRTLTLPRQPSRAPDCALRFPTAREGLRTLLSPRAIGRIVEGMNTGATDIEGNAVLMLWFYGLTRVVAPIGRSRLPRRPIPAPVRKPESEAAYATRITREPVVSRLDPAWEAGWRGRERLLHIRATRGATLPPGWPRHSDDGRTQRAGQGVAALHLGEGHHARRLVERRRAAPLVGS